jgi:hypothetical protein
MSVSVTTSLTTAVLPVPIVPTQAPILNNNTTGTTTGIPAAPAPTVGDPAYGFALNVFAQGNSSGIPGQLNMLLAAMSLASLYGGNGHGVVTGFDLSESSSLVLTVGIGTALIGAPIQFKAATTLTLPDATAYIRIWLKQDGTLTYTTSTTPPTATALFLGTATTAGGVITALDNAGVVRLSTGTPVRVVGDAGRPTDSLPGAMVMLTQTAAGFYHWNGAAHQPLGTPTNTQSISGTLTLDEYAAPLQLITPTGAARTVKLPASPRVGDSIRIVNAALTAGGYNLVVKDSTGTTTICTLTPGQSTTPIYPNVGGASSSPKYPTATITPV